MAAPGEPDSARQFIDGGIWRYHPQRKTFEVFARGLSNPWGFDFDDVLYLFAPIVWLGWQMPFVVGASVGAGVAYYLSTIV